MPTKKFMTIAISFNILIGLLLFLSSEIVLTALNGAVVKGAGVFIDYASSYSGPIQYTPTGVSAPLLNYPLFVLMSALAVNVFFLIRLRMTK
jgi:hypothetical protein